MTTKALVLFDGDCAFCQHSVRWLRRFDWRGRLEFVNVRESENPLLQGVAVEPARLLEEMHVVPPGSKNVYHGFGALRWMAWRLPPLWPLAPFMYLPLVPWLGQKAYLWVARNRFRLVPCQGNVCSIQRRGS